MLVVVAEVVVVVAMLAIVAVVARLGILVSPVAGRFLLLLDLLDVGQPSATFSHPSAPIRAE